MRRLQLFPYSLVRIAGGPYEDFTKTNFTKIPKIIDKALSLENELNFLKIKTSQKLYQLIPLIKNNELRKLIVQLRRNVFNNRPLDTNDYFMSALPLEARLLLKSYNNMRVRLEGINKLGESVYEEESKKIKKEFIKLLKKPNFQNGILLSSDNLFEELEKYLKSDIDNSRLEHTFIKYLSRMYTKTSPFSTFTQLAISTFDFNSDNNTSLFVKKGQLRSSIKVNSFFYKYFFSYIRDNKILHKYLNIKANFTTKIYKNKYVYLANNSNHEIVQCITITPALKFLYEVAISKKRWQYVEYLDAINSKKYINATSKDIHTFVDKLINYGFFEYDLDISEINSFRAKKFSLNLLTFPKKLPKIDLLATSVESIEKLSLLYGQTQSPSKRIKIINQAYNMLKDTSYKLYTQQEKLKGGIVQNSRSNVSKSHSSSISTKKHIFPIKRNQMWYEDTSLSGQFSIRGKVDRIFDQLGKFLLFTGPFDPCLNERENITYFFEKKYGLNSKIDLVKLYNDYNMSNSRIGKNTSLNPLSLKREEKNNIFLKKIYQQIKYNVKNQENINLNSQVFNNILRENKNYFSLYTPKSFGTSIQFIVTKKSIVKAVINRATPGYGKIFSRFLNLFDKKITTCIFNNNKIADAKAVCAEVRDANNFNADIHPQLVPTEIIIPGGYYSNNISKKIRIDQIVVSYSKKKKCLILSNKISKKEIFIFDFGFTSHYERSKLYSFLLSFRLGGHPNYLPINDFFNNKIKKTKSYEIILLPRIVYEKNIILQRKTWIVPKHLLPMRLVNEKKYSYTYRIRQWQQQNHIPDEFFLKANIQTNLKPQYISFKNPLLIDLFEKLVNNTESEIIISEMLPSSKEFLPITNKNYVTEFFVQWY